MTSKAIKGQKGHLQISKSSFSLIKNSMNTNNIKTDVLMDNFCPCFINKLNHYVLKEELYSCNDKK